MPNKPLVSIIIPTYNRAHLIGETLDSVLGQIYTNWECIVVDDGSTDGTEELLNFYVAKDGRFQYHKRPDSHLPGGNGARNYGFEISKGKYVQWFDDDDIMLPDFISLKLKEIKGCDFVICSCYVTDNILINRELVKLTIKTDLFRDYILWNFQIITHSILFSRDFLKDRILFNPNIYRGQETEFFSRVFFKIAVHQYKIINTPLFLYRQHEGTKSTKNKIYRANYNWSKSYIAVENLKRGFLINDEEIVKLYYDRLIYRFFLSIKHKDQKSSKLIFKELSQILKNKSFKFYAEFMIVGNYLRYSEKGKYYFHKRWKKINISSYID